MPRPARFCIQRISIYQYVRKSELRIAYACQGGEITRRGIPRHTTWSAWPSEPCVPYQSSIHTVYLLHLTESRVSSPSLRRPLPPSDEMTSYCALVNIADASGDHGVSRLSTQWRYPIHANGPVSCAPSARWRHRCSNSERSAAAVTTSAGSEDSGLDELSVVNCVENQVSLGCASEWRREGAI